MLRNRTSHACPRCTAPGARISVSGNNRMPFLVRLFLVCLRCHACGIRFYRQRIGLKFTEERKPRTVGTDERKGEVAAVELS